MKKYLPAIITILIIATIIVAIFFVYKNKKPAAIINNFDDCAEANNIILESYPEQCRTADGRTFTRNIGNELEKQDLIQVTSPRPSALIASPLIITGQARGNWFFEASFPIKLLDENNQEIGTTIAQAKSDWMTENFVPFEAVLNFTAPTGQKGKLILKKDNPSGLSEYDDQLEIPIYFR